MAYKPQSGAPVDENPLGTSKMVMFREIYS